MNYAEYIWLDGTEPTALLRSKTRVLELPEEPSVADFPKWGFDGSSTNQATGNNSDCELMPVRIVPDPIRGFGSYLVLCEVNDEKGNPHPSNTRALLRKVLDNGADKQDAMFGYEQEYTFYQNGKPLGWPSEGYPGPQGPYYCGVGTDRIYGRDIVEEHLAACTEAGLMIYGVNAEVMPGQWEFQIGPRDVKGEDTSPLRTVDDVWLATWLLNLIAEAYDVQINFENKPVKGDWNGAGCHTNFSTKDMRDPKTGVKAIEDAINALAAKHHEHIVLYGHGLEERLTGLHETCDITTFKHGEADRGASIRVPLSTAQKGYGYLEDRRPGANSDPYIVASRLLVTICRMDEAVLGAIGPRPVPA